VLIPLPGVTIVQYREKTSDTGALIHTAKALHAKCRQHNIPLIINDRVDVALAVDCEGVHLGQDDMSITTARSILGPEKIIGATVSSIAEARIAVDEGADYLGIGTLYATNTKKNTKDIIGINGIRKILHYLDYAGEVSKAIKTVCIGGINAKNLQRIMYQLYAPSSSATKPKTIDGVAIVSAIISPEDTQTATSHLRTLLSTTPPFQTKESPTNPSSSNSPFDLSTALQAATLAVHITSPITHNMTNTVVQNLSANIALALGASPIMSLNSAEAPDLAALSGALVINMGTMTSETLTHHRAAISAYNAVGGPVVLDPVGAGATSARKEGLSWLMAGGYFDVIKGNEAEIMAVVRASGLELVNGSTQQQKGVDSSPSHLTLLQKAHIAFRLALRERTIILLTGATDILTDGRNTYAISNGHAYLGMVTGSGCSLGTTISAYLAASREDKLIAALAAIVHFEIAAEDAAAREDVMGPGTFVPAFIDELCARRMDVVKGGGRADWVGRMKVELLENIPDAGLLRET
jgi:thiamine-phosphate diphosphorylase/hydroxyethylthiazole kinase